MDRARNRPLPALLMLCAAGLTLACGDEGGPLLSPSRSVNAAKGGGNNSGVSVTAADPSYGTPGTVSEAVTITGSGFQSGAQASWLFLNDSADTTITVLSTSFVNSTTITSVIKISRNAQVAFRNIRVTNADRTKGIGNAVFEVTQAIPVPGAGIFRAVNSSGQFAGGGPGGTVLWSSASGVVTVNNDGAQGFALSATGRTIVANNFPRVYTRPGPVGTPWQLTMLPVDPRATAGGAWALLADPATEQPLVIGGRISIPLSKKSGYEQPLAWTWQASTGSWQMHPLPFPGVSGGAVIGISADTIVVGWVGGTPGCCAPGPLSTAATWRADDAGSWSVTTIGPVGRGPRPSTPRGR